MYGEPYTFTEFAAHYGNEAEWYWDQAAPTKTQHPDPAAEARQARCKLSNCAGSTQQRQHQPESDEQAVVECCACGAPACCCDLPTSCCRAPDQNSSHTAVHSDLAPARDSNTKPFESEAPPCPTGANPILVREREQRRLDLINLGPEGAAVAAVVRASFRSDDDWWHLINTQVSVPGLHAI